MANGQASNMARVVSWESAANGALTLSAVYAVHRPASKFRISSQSYPKHTQFSGISIAGRLYVLRGSCSYRVGDVEWQLRAPAYVDFPAGEFIFRADTDVEIVQVWEIPRVC